MKNIKYKSLLLSIVWFFIACTMLYGLSRLYYHSTGGFSLHNIRSDYSFESRWVTRPLTNKEQQVAEGVLSQKFHYLGKGCQSYVFGSEDENYVIKFFKHQRMRPKKWVEYFTFLPFVNNLYLKKMERKREKREGVFGSWKIAFDHLSDETGITYVHLNKTDHLNKSLRIVDKTGYEHNIWIDDYEFMIQKQAKMLCDVIDELMDGGHIDQAACMLVTMVDTILSEYHRGFADNDHALMQNTGVFYGKPIHIDVGQFVSEEIVKNPEFHMQELYTKTYKFRLWLREMHPDLCDQFDTYLQIVMGDQFLIMQPLWRDHIEIFQ